MNTLSLTVRLISAAAAAAVTLTLLGSVFAIAEPQRSMLIAKLQHADQPATPIALALASGVAAKTKQ